MQWMLPPPKTTCSVVFAFALMVVVALGLRAYSRTIVPEEPAEEELAAARPAPIWLGTMGTGNSLSHLILPCT